MKSEENVSLVVKVAKKWCCGDFIYGAINGVAPAGVHYLWLNGREYPVARLHISCVDDENPTYTVVRWVKRDEQFPVGEYYL